MRCRRWVSRNCLAFYWEKNIYVCSWRNFGVEKVALTSALLAPASSVLERKYQRQLRMQFTRCDWMPAFSVSCCRKGKKHKKELASTETWSAVAAAVAIAALCRARSPCPWSVSHVDARGNLANWAPRLWHVELQWKVLPNKNAWTTPSGNSVWSIEWTMWHAISC